MSSPQVAGENTPSLARDWLHALRYWLRGRRGVAVLVVSAVAIGGALNWSWLAAGIAPLLVTVLPCAVMCGLGLCMNKMTGRSCSTSSGSPGHSSTPMLNAVQRIAADSEPAKRAPASHTAGAGAPPDLSSRSAAEPAPDRQPQVLKERE
jgi:hypothetical protein